MVKLFIKIENDNLIYMRVLLMSRSVTFRIQISDVNGTGIPRDGTGRDGTGRGSRPAGQLLKIEQKKYFKLF